MGVLTGFFGFIFICMKQRTHEALRKYKTLKNDQNYIKIRGIYVSERDFDFVNMIYGLPCGVSKLFTVF